MSQSLKILKALTDATRLRLVALLSREELSVNELQEITELGQSRISTHLGVLQENGLLTFRKTASARCTALIQRPPVKLGNALNWPGK